MADIQTIVNQVKRTAQDRQLTAFYNYVQGISWNVCPTAVDGSSVVKIDPEADAGTAYPTLFNCTNPQQALWAELGRDFIRREEKRLRHWQFKYDTAPSAAVIGVQQLLSSCAFAKYRDLIQTINEPVSRLVAINVANAFLANRIPIQDACGLDITKHSATSDYCGGKRYHSLVPLWSVYCPPSIQHDYGLALAYATSFQLKPLVSCSSFQEPVQALVLRLAQ